MSTLSPKQLKKVDSLFFFFCCIVASFARHLFALRRRSQQLAIVRPGGMGDLICLQIALEQSSYDLNNVIFFIETRAEAWAKEQKLHYVCYDRGLLKTALIYGGRFSTVVNSEQRFGLAQAFSLLLTRPEAVIRCFSTNRGARFATERIPYQWDSSHESVEFSKLLHSHRELSQRKRLYPSSTQIVVGIAGLQAASRTLTPAQWEEWIRSCIQDRPFILVSAPVDREFSHALCGRFHGQANIIEGDFSRICEIIRNAEELLTIDGGMVHLASYYGVKTHALFTAGIADKWGPLAKESRIVTLTNLPCQPCTKFGQVAECPLDYLCTKGIQYNSIEPQKSSQLPIVVDLDGTLALGDTALEILAWITIHRPLRLPYVLWQLTKSRAKFKTVAALVSKQEISRLPFSEHLVNWLIKKSKEGVPIYLATGASKILAQKVTRHFGWFNGFFASSHRTNLIGSAKADLLVKTFGKHGFIYVGNSSSDLAVWQQAAQGVVCGNHPKLLKRARKTVQVVGALRHPSLFPAAFRQLRVHQWAKNVLVFLPGILSHQILQPQIFFSSLLAFFAFSFAASSIYGINDLFDIESDRVHPRKCKRPLASGALPLWFLPILVIGTLSCATLFASMLPLQFTEVLALYILATLLYSSLLKRFLILDVLCLAVLYTMRIYAGGFATSIEISHWLILCSVFCFSSLALMKRFIELKSLQEQGSADQHISKKAAGRAYEPSDIPIIMALGCASAMVGVLVLGLYLTAPEGERLYRHPSFLWGISLTVLYWFSRFWILAGRGKIHDDPIATALTDRASQLCGALCLGIFLLSI